VHGHIRFFIIDVEASAFLMNEKAVNWKNLKALRISIFRQDRQDEQDIQHSLKVENL